VTTVMPMQCFACVRLHQASDPDTGTQLAATCDAFPGGIPPLMGRGGDHRNPLPGDHGLRFQQADGTQARVAFAAWSRFSRA